MSQGYASENQVNWGEVAAQSRTSYAPKPKPAPKVDEIVSRVVGKNVLANDPRLIKAVNNWRMNRQRSPDDLRSDNFLQDPAKVKELKRIFA